MKKVYEYSHLGGAEILAVRYPEISADIDAAIAGVGGVSPTKVSREKTMRGRLLYSPKVLNARFHQEFEARGFREIRDTFDISLPGYDLVVRHAFKQVDFARDSVLVEVQFGKYAFMFYDLAKFQYFFNEADAEVGVEIVPCWALHRRMSTGVSYGEQLVHDVIRLRRHFPAVPVKIILIDVDDADAAG